MKIVTYAFASQDGHLDSVDPLTNKEKLITAIEDEARENGHDWLDDNEVTLGDLRKADGEDLITLCESLQTRGYFRVIEF